MKNLLRCISADAHQDLFLNKFQLSYSQEYCNWSTVVRDTTYSSVLCMSPYFYDKGIQNTAIGSGSLIKQVDFLVKSLHKHLCGNGIRNKIFLLVFTSVVLFLKYGESGFRQDQKSMGKQNIPSSRVSYLFREKPKYLQLPKLKTWEQ